MPNVFIPLTASCEKFGIKLIFNISVNVLGNITVLLMLVQGSRFVKCKTDANWIMKPDLREMCKNCISKTCSFKLYC